MFVLSKFEILPSGNTEKPYGLDHSHGETHLAEACHQTRNSVLFVHEHPGEGMTWILDACAASPLPHELKFKLVQGGKM